MPNEFIILINQILYVLTYFSAVLKISPDDFEDLQAKKNSIIKFLYLSFNVSIKNEEKNMSKLISTHKKLEHPQDNY